MRSVFFKFLYTELIWKKIAMNWVFFRSPTKMKKHGKPSFKLAKKDKFKVKEKVRNLHDFYIIHTSSSTFCMKPLAHHIHFNL